MILTPGNPKELAEAQTFDLEKNDAEIIDLAERAQGRPFKHLDKDSYARKSITAKGEVPTVSEFKGWRKGQTVRIALDNPLGHERVSGEIEAITADGLFLRVQGRFYPATRAKRSFV